MNNPVRRLFSKVKEEAEYHYYDKKNEILVFRKLDKEEAVEYYQNLDDKMLKFAYQNTKSKRDLKIIEKALKERGYRYSKAFKKFIE